MAHSIVEEYFSGQGVLMVGPRDALGNPAGLRPLGNVPNVSIKNATTVVEHKESTTGARGTDKRLLTEVKVSIDITVENFDSTNLASVLQGTYSQVAGSSVVGEPVKGYPGLVSPLAHLRASAFVLKKSAATLTPFVNNSTAWDYKINLDAGSFQLNDGSTTAFSSNLGVAATAITVGATTVVTITHNAAVGDTFYFGQGWAGANASQVNGKSGIITAVTGTTAVTVALVTSGTITVGTNLCAWSGMALLADYTWASQQQVQAFTTGIPELYLRFEGLNTAENNSPVVVDVFKFAVDPTQDFSLISDQIQQFVLSGSILKDSLQATGSQYYRVTKVDNVA